MEELGKAEGAFSEKEGFAGGRDQNADIKDYADGLLPEGVIEQAQGFSEEEVRKLENYLRFNRKEILKQAKEINPLRNWLTS